MLNSINLSLSAACDANCVFCPVNRGKRHSQKIMPFDLVKKIVDEVASPDLSRAHQITTFQIGENGDAFLNKDVIEILRYMKNKLPAIKIILFNSFQHFSPDKARVILREKLIDRFYCNIDGSNEVNYFAVKKLDLKITADNLINFLKIRSELNNEAPLHINVITLNHYIRTIKRNFGFYPNKLKDLTQIHIPDDFLIIKAQWEKFLDPKKDGIFRPVIFGWAERGRFDPQKVAFRKYSCPLLSMIQTTAFIAPDGTWYACCVDSDNEVVMGNVSTDTIASIYSGKRRAGIIELLEKRKFDKVGGPCRTVNCCQYFLSLPAAINLFRISTGHYLANKLHNLCHFKIAG